MDIVNLLKGPESKTLEFKQDLSSPKGVLRTMVAFANSAGGIIVLGVEDKTKYICGVADPVPLEGKLLNLTNDCIEPQLIPEIKVVPWRETYLLVIEVFPSSVKPHFISKQGLEKGTYIRVGSSNRPVDSTTLAELQRVKDSFEKQAISKLNSEAIDFRVASELFESVKKLNKTDLHSMDLVTTYQNKQVPTAAGVILFGKDRLKYFPDAWIQVGRFAGTTKTHILDTQEITSYPILAIDEVMLFIKKHAMHGIVIPGGGDGGGHGSGAGFGDGTGDGRGGLSTLRHKDTWSLPLTAIREAIINAVVHADYAQQGSPIRLAIFDDRIEIENPGLLLSGLTIDEIKRGVSKLRNQVIGQIFYRLGLIERWGSGIRRIIDSCLEAGFPEPMFEEIGTHFRVTLFTRVVTEPSIDDIDKIILSALKKESNGLSTKEVSEAINKSQRAARVRLINLIERGLVVEIGQSVNDPGKKYFCR